ASHSRGTLTEMHRNRRPRPQSRGLHARLQFPGDQATTAHVDLTSVRAAAEGEGLQALRFLDQTYRLLGLLPPEFGNQQSIRNLKTLILPGSLGSTHKVMIFGKGVGMPALRGCSYKMRVT